MKAQSIMYDKIYKRSIVKDDFAYSTLREGLLLVLTLLVLAYIHYRTTEILSIAAQCIILYLYYKSPNNYPWIFILCFVSFNPGGLFGTIHGIISLISIPMLGYLSFEMMFILISWIKVSKTGKPIFVMYKTSYIIIVLYFLFLFPFFGARPASFIRIMIYFSWLILIPQLLSRQKEIEKLLHLLLIANILVFLSNIYQIIITREIVSIFILRDVGVVFTEFGERYMRTVSGIQFAYLAVIVSLIYLSKVKSPIKPLYSYLSLLIGVLNIIFSATRGWIFATIFLILAYVFFMIPRVVRNIFIIIPIVSISILSIWQIPIIRYQIIRAYERTLYREDLTDWGTETTEIGRLIRGQRVMEKFRESPIIGFGFGDEGREYLDGHTGNQSMLLSFGIIGYLLFIYLWGGFLLKLLLLDNIFRPKNPEYRINVLICLAFLSVFIIHSTSGAFLHPGISAPSVIWYSIIFAYGNYIYNNYKMNAKKTDNYYVR